MQRTNYLKEGFKHLLDLQFNRPLDKALNADFHNKMEDMYKYFDIYIKVQNYLPADIHHTSQVNSLPKN